MFLSMKAIRVEFPGVLAVDGADLTVEAGEVRAIVGENGAGKSTLVKVLAGVYPAGGYGGEIVLEGETLSLSGVEAAEERGIVMIPQEMSMVDDRSIAENIFLNRVPSRRGVVDERALYADAEAVLELVDLDASPTTLVGELGTAQKQMVAIASALSKNVKVLVLDEPTATLSGHESDLLFARIAELADRGISCVYISHRLEEVLRIADAVTVMRDGRVVDTRPAPGLAEKDVVELMIGREMGDYYPERHVVPGDVAFRATGVRVPHPMVPGIDVVDDVSLEVRAGEVLGVFGLVGAGRTEMASALVGHGDGASFEEVVVGDHRVTAVGHPREALDQGYGYLPEDRKTMTVLPNLDVNRNISIGSLRRLAPRLRVDARAELTLAERFRNDLRIKTVDLETPVANLSGGNQQKVMLARLMAQDLDVLILDEPTQGVDVGAKAEIYTILNDAVSAGAAIVMISSDLPEVLGMADRVLVMHRGRVAGTVDAKTTSPREVLELATLGSAEEKS